MRKSQKKNELSSTNDESEESSKIKQKTSNHFGFSLRKGQFKTTGEVSDKVVITLIIVSGILFFWLLR